MTEPLDTVALWMTRTIADFFELEIANHIDNGFSEPTIATALDTIRQNPESVEFNRDDAMALVVMLSVLPIVGDRDIPLALILANPNARRGH